jgi:ribosomal protein S18 acetylase RimI-like enzyme
MHYTLRNAKPSDIEELINLCAEHAEYEKASYSREGKAEKLAAHLFSPTTTLSCLIAEQDNKILGYATYLVEYSTWDADFFVYMDCLYLREACRGFGIGEALVKKIEEQARLKNIKQIQWHTPVFNVRAIHFYRRIGADSKEKVRFYYPIK